MDFYNIPIGFGMALAMNPPAFNAYSNLTEEEKDALIAIVGATVNLGLVWDVSDTFNGFMIVPNLIAVFLLAPTVFQMVKEHFQSK